MPLVRFFANLRQITGLKEKTVPGSSLRLVFASLEQEYPQFGEYLHGNVSRRLIITINGHPLDPQAGLDIPVSETDQIAIFPPISGG